MKLGRLRPIPWALLVALGAALVTGPAAADGTSDEAALHFDLGKQEYKKGRFEIAIGHFFVAQSLAPNRNVLFNIAGAYEALSRYADAYRYYVDAQQGETDAAKRADAQAAIARMAPNVAVIEVATDPPGATIYLQRKELGSVGTSPRPLGLAPGKYRVIAELPGHETRTSEELTVEQGKRVTVALSLPLIVGAVHVDASGGASAVVRVDSEGAAPACSTPCDLTLPPGRHDLYFEAPGNRVEPRSVVVVAGQTVSATGVLVPLVGTLLLRTEERGAAVSVDDKAVGFTPLVARDIPVGRHTVRVEQAGYRPYTTTIEMARDAKLEIANLALTPLREVTAVSRTTESVDDAPASVTVLDRRELAAFGYPTIYEALRGVRGISLSNDRAFPTASVRGIGQPGDYGNRFLVLSDGQSLNENVGATSFTAHEARVDLGDVDRIEIVRGPGSLLYGTGAVSGVLNLVLRPPVGPDEIHAGAGVYDNNVARARVGFQKGFGAGRSVWASATAARSGGFDLTIPLGDGPRVARGVEAFTTGGTAGRVTVGPVTAQWFYHRRQQSVPIGAYGADFDDPRTRLDDQRFTSELRVEPRISDRVQVLARAHAHHYRALATYALTDSVLDEDYTGTWLGAEARLVFRPFDWLRLTAGGEGQLHPEASLFGKEVANDGEEDVYLDEKHPYSLGAGYLLAEGSPAEWFRFSAGARVDVSSVFGAVVVPRAAAIFRPTPGHTLKLMGGRAFRAPSVYELYYNDGGFSQTPAQDEARGLSLSPESAIQGEVEYTGRFLQDWVVVAAAHGMFIEGILGTVPDTAGSEVIRYANGEAPALVLGGELEIRREWRRGLMLAASYGYQRAQLLDSGAANARLENAPEHLASARFVVPVVRDIASLGFRASLEAPRRIRADDDATTKAAVVADVTVSGAVQDLGIRYVLGVYNFADARYEVPVEATFASRTMPQNGRRFLLDLQWAWR